MSNDSPSSKNKKNTPRKKQDASTHHRAAIDTHVRGLMKAIEAAHDGEYHLPAKDLAVLTKLSEVISKLAASPPVAPFTPLPPQQMPTTWQIAQLAALIGQGQCETLGTLAHDLGKGPTASVSASEDGYQIANSLTNAALTLWRSAHDMRQIWQVLPKLQQNYQAAKIRLFAPSHDEQEKRESRAREILAKFLTPKPSDKSGFDERTARYWTSKDSRGQPSVDSYRFAEYWKDLAFVTWNDAAILFFRDEVAAQGQERLGKATPVQSKRFATFCAEYLEKATRLKDGKKPDTAHFIKAWQETSAETSWECRPAFLQPGCFTDLWYGLIGHFEAHAIEWQRVRMQSVRHGNKSGNEASS